MPVISSLTFFPGKYNTAANRENARDESHYLCSGIKEDPQETIYSEK